MNNINDERAKSLDRLATATAMTAICKLSKLSCLTDRQQFVTIDGKRSDSLMIRKRVPQGSVLGPVLFLLFVNDIPLHLSGSSVDIYADDTTVMACAYFSDI